VFWSWCFVQNVFGIDCPGCKLGRSVSELLQGHIQQSIVLHPMGIVLVVAVLNFWWWRKLQLSHASRQVVSHSVLAGFLIPWVIGFFI